MMSGTAFTASATDLQETPWTHAFQPPAAARPKDRFEEERRVSRSGGRMSPDLQTRSWCTPNASTSPLEGSSRQPESGSGKSGPEPQQPASCYVSMMRYDLPTRQPDSRNTVQLVQPCNKRRLASWKVARHGPEARASPARSDPVWSARPTTATPAAGTAASSILDLSLWIVAANAPTGRTPCPSAAGRRNLRACRSRRAAGAVGSCAQSLVATGFDSFAARPARERRGVRPGSSPRRDRSPQGSRPRATVQS